MATLTNARVRAAKPRAKAVAMLEAHAAKLAEVTS